MIGVFDRPNLFFLDGAFNARGTQELDPAMTIVAISQEDFDGGTPLALAPQFDGTIGGRDSQTKARSDRHGYSLQRKHQQRDPDQFEESQPYLYPVLAGVKLEARSEDGVKVIGPGNPAFDEAALGVASAIAQDQELAGTVDRFDLGRRFCQRGRRCSGQHSMVRPL